MTVNRKLLEEIGTDYYSLICSVILRNFQNVRRFFLLTESADTYFQKCPRVFQKCPRVRFTVIKKKVDD